VACSSLRRDRQPRDRRSAPHSPAQRQIASENHAKSSGNNVEITNNADRGAPRESPARSICSIKDPMRSTSANGKRLNSPSVSIRTISNGGSASPALASEPARSQSRRHDFKADAVEYDPTAKCPELAQVPRQPYSRKSNAGISAAVLRAIAWNGLKPENKRMVFQLMRRSHGQIDLFDTLAGSLQTTAKTVPIETANRHRAAQGNPCDTDLVKPPGARSCAPLKPEQGTQVSKRL